MKSSGTSETNLLRVHRCQQIQPLATYKFFLIMQVVMYLPVISMRWETFDPVLLLGTLKRDCQMYIEERYSSVRSSTIDLFKLLGIMLTELVLIMSIIFIDSRIKRGVYVSIIVRGSIRITGNAVNIVI